MDDDTPLCVDGCGREATTERLIRVEAVPATAHMFKHTGGDGIVETVELVCLACKHKE